MLGPGMGNCAPFAAVDLVELVGQLVEQHVVADLPLELLCARVGKLLAVRG
jgi:hypothetical protein